MTIKNGKKKAKNAINKNRTIALLMRETLLNHSDSIALL
jgi:hypothetical protein